MSRNQEGWAATSSDSKTELPVVELGPAADISDGRVVSFGAFCSLASDNTSPTQISISIAEFLEMESGKHVVLRNDRGVTSSRIQPLTGQPKLTEEDIEANVLAALQPDEGEEEGPGEKHFWKELSRLAQTQNVTVSPEDLRALPYRFFLTAELREFTKASDQ